MREPPPWASWELGSMPDVTAREALSQAIRYWEPRRILFNALLLFEVAIVFVVNLPGARSHVDVNLGLLLFVLAVLANVAYCACSVVGVFAQLSPFRETWLRFRLAAFLLGVVVAGA